MLNRDENIWRYLIAEFYTHGGSLSQPHFRLSEGLVQTKLHRSMFVSLVRITGCIIPTLDWAPCIVTHTCYLQQRADIFKFLLQGAKLLVWELKSTAHPQKRHSLHLGSQYFPYCLQMYAIPGRSNSINNSSTFKSLTHVHMHLFWGKHMLKIKHGA